MACSLGFHNNGYNMNCSFVYWLFAMLFNLGVATFKQQVKCFLLSSLSCRNSHFFHLMRLFVKCMSKQHLLAGNIQTNNENTSVRFTKWCLFTSIAYLLTGSCKFSFGITPEEKLFMAKSLPHLPETDQNNDIHLIGLLINVKIISALTEAYFIRTQLNSPFSESTSA